jgi:hypothetical protein
VAEHGKGQQLADFHQHLGHMHILSIYMENQVFR